MGLWYLLRTVFVEFTKMNGAGNDFVCIDNRAGGVELSTEQVAKLCHRQRGVGADGVMVLVPNEGGEADWSWEFYNSDGSEADMCGNGARCFARFIQRATDPSGDISFLTGAGVIRASFDGERVTVNLTAPKDFSLNQKLATADGEVTVHSVNTGVPHAVVFVEDADKAMVVERGRELRFHSHFGKSGTNVNFVQKLGDNRIRVRTYERGVEGETLACGTGVCAAAIVSAATQGLTSPVSVRVQGGDDLEVYFDQEGESFSNIRLKGPADFAFDGKIEL